MRIEEIYIDGYKNIKNTHLVFSGRPITVLLAENNYGKTNLLEGIRDGFKILYLKGAACANFLEEATYASFPKNGIQEKFTFDVIFTSDVVKKSKKDLRLAKEGKMKCYKYNTSEESALENEGEDGYTYRYKIVIDPNKPTIKDKFDEDIGDDSYFIKRNITGVVEEELSIVTRKDKDGSWQLHRQLFKRHTEESNWATAHYDGEHIGEYEEHQFTVFDDTVKYRMKVSAISHHSLRLFLHMFGIVAINVNIAGSGLEATCPKWMSFIYDVYGAFVFFTKEQIGEILVDESVALNDFGNIENELLKLNTDVFNCVAASILKMYRIQMKRIPECKPQFLELKKFKYFIENSEGLSEPAGLSETEDKIETVSHGVRRALKLLMGIFGGNSPLISVECLENGFHPKLYRALLYTFKNCIENNHFENSCKTLVFSSHSCSLLDNFLEEDQSVDAHEAEVNNSIIRNKEKWDSAYFGDPCCSEGARFAKLTIEGINEAKNVPMKPGDYIFKHYSSEFLNDSLSEMLDEGNSHINIK